ncbi:signal transduction histidine kinase [Xenococcus sp. PCC 7305]|uniref:ATP-binding response regulator n=1 Tax=Xenococcus sp. PCC 7305 TaxID=102125 RepID=UPI0002ABD177|nr:ATP-binding protein [Xenococcus sp. PCC 7305]ELS02479.1 signal transduction histidine kinase [Xenococcus sp. PCC 7305]
MSHSIKSSSQDNYSGFSEKSNYELKTSSKNNYQTNYHNSQQILKLEQELQDAKKSIQLLNQKLIVSNQNLEKCNIKYHKKNQKLTQLNIELENALLEMENSLRASAQLEAANRAKDVFIAQMNHELRTPLTSILGFSHLLQQDHKLDSKQLSYVDIINHSGQHLLNLINDILDYSKITAEKLELELRDFHLIDFLNEIVTVFVIRTQPKGLDFKTIISPDLPIIVQADETKLRQVLDNLLNNAIKFTDTGSITLKVDHIQDHNSPTSDTPHNRSLKKIRFQIEDTGIGIPTEQIAEVFTPFTQLNDNAQKYEGTGLGLTISQNIIQLMGSEIQLESQVNQGSKFWFDLDMLGLDAYIKPKLHNISSQATRQLQKPRKILVVDNSDDNRNLLVNCLQSWGFIVKETNDCKVGLTVATRFRPDVIIVDVAMSKMDGVALITKLKEHSQLRDTVIIMISADSQLISNSAKIGCHGFLSKPIDLEQLQKLLASYLPLAEQLCESSKNQDNLASPMTPSQQELMNLLELADIGDIEAIEEQINSLEFLDEQLSSFGQEVRKLAMSFKQHQLENFLKSFIFD